MPSVVLTIVFDPKVSFGEGLVRLKYPILLVSRHVIGAKSCRNDQYIGPPYTSFSLAAWFTSGVVGASLAERTPLADAEVPDPCEGGRSAGFQVGSSRPGNGEP